MLHWSQPAQTKGKIRQPKMPEGSPTLLIEANAVRRRVFFNSTDCKGSKGAVCRALSSNTKTQEGREEGLGVFNLLAPLRNLTTRLCFLTYLPPIGLSTASNSRQLECQRSWGPVHTADTALYVYVRCTLGARCMCSQASGQDISK